MKRFRSYFQKKPVGNMSSNETSSEELSKSLEKNIAYVQSAFAGDELLITRRLQNKYLPAAHGCLLFYIPMIDHDSVNHYIIQPFLRTNLAEAIDRDNLLEELMTKVLTSHRVKIATDWDTIIQAVLIGDTVFLLEKSNQALIIGSKGWKSRSIAEPESAKAFRGPREGFNEVLNTNIALMRRIINHPDLRFKFRQIGEKTRTRVCICYLEGVASEEVLNELEERLNRIKIDGILDSGYIQELIQDAPLSPFNTVGSSEKPDAIAGKILEGRVALLVDGSPSVLTVPFVLAENVQASEDYYNNYYFASINRLIREFAVFASFGVPALYLALVNYHQEMLPTPLLLSIAASRQGVPFPSGLSMLAMLLVFDIIREASTRMSSSIGQTVNIVGTLVLGQAAVEARLVSAPIVIVTAFSGITTLMNPGLLSPTILIRTFLIIGTLFMGIYGLLFSFILVILHLMNIRSFGVPYTLGLTAVRGSNAKDIWIRFPWRKMVLRPSLIGDKDMVRQSPPKKGN